MSSSWALSPPAVVLSVSDTEAVAAGPDCWNSNHGIVKIENTYWNLYGIYLERDAERIRCAFAITVGRAAH